MESKSKQIKEAYEKGDGIMLIADAVLLTRMEKRVRQIAQEVCSMEFANSLPNMDRIELAFTLKRIAIEYNCYIRSWLTIDDADAECYNIDIYNDEDDTTYGLVAAPTEPGAVIVSFLWLSDRGNFTPAVKRMIESGMNS